MTGDSSGATDAADLYFGTRDELIDIATGLTDEQLSTSVPMSPEWSVQDTVAHVCGINADVISQRFEGFGSDEWTAYQVDTRRGQSIADICAEWSGFTSALGAHFAKDPFFGVRLTGDLIIHLQDIQHALNLPIDQAHPAALVGGARYVPHLQERVRDAMDGAAVAINLIDGASYPAVEGTVGDLALRVSSYDFLRSVTGRRSRRQVEALDWTGEPTDLLDRAWAAYGELRTDDVSV